MNLNVLLTLKWFKVLVFLSNFHKFYLLLIICLHTVPYISVLRASVVLKNFKHLKSI